MSRRTRRARKHAQSYDEPRRLTQLVQQRQLQQSRQDAKPYLQADQALPDKQQQTQHNAVSEGLPFGLFTSDQ